MSQYPLNPGKPRKGYFHTAIPCEAEEFQDCLISHAGFNATGRFGRTINVNFVPEKQKGKEPKYTSLEVRVYSKQKIDGIKSWRLLFKPDGESFKVRNAERRYKSEEVELEKKDPQFTARALGYAMKILLSDEFRRELGIANATDALDYDMSYELKELLRKPPSKKTIGYHTGTWN